MEVPEDSIGSGIKMEFRFRREWMKFDSTINSFLQDNIAILDKMGTGLTPIVTTDSQNSASAIHGRVEFHRFGEPIQVSDFDSSDLSISGGNLASFTVDETDTILAYLQIHIGRVQLIIEKAAVGIAPFLLETFIKIANSLRKRIWFFGIF